jgi:hypothetical protein
MISRLLFMFAMTWHQAVSSLDIVGISWPTPRDVHVVQCHTGFYSWERRTYKPCGSNVYNPTGILAEHRGYYQGLDAVTYQALFPD